MRLKSKLKFNLGMKAGAQSQVDSRSKSIRTQLPRKNETRREQRREKIDSTKILNFLFIK